LPVSVPSPAVVVAAAAPAIPSTSVVQHHHNHCRHQASSATCRGIHTEKKKRQKKSFFICGTTFKKNESGRDFQQPDLEQSLTKTKQRIMAGTHLQKNIRV